MFSILFGLVITICCGLTCGLTGGITDGITGGITGGLTGDLTYVPQLVHSTGVPLPPPELGGTFEPVELGPCTRRREASRSAQ